MTGVPTPGQVIDDLLHGNNAVEGDPITIDKVAFPENIYATTGYYSYSWKSGVGAGTTIRSADLQTTWNPYYGNIKVYIKSSGTCSVTCNGVTRQVANNSNTTFSVLPGTYTVTATYNNITKSQQVSVSANATQSVTLYLYAFPTYTYTGSHNMVKDESTGNWVLYLKSSGTLRFTDNLLTNIDVFLVGGGGAGGISGDYGGGGGSGYVKTTTNISASLNTNYTITIGSGGAAVAGFGTNQNGGNGSATTGFNQTANGGQGGRASMGYAYYGKGGSGGSGGGGTDVGKNQGGSDGSNGNGWSTSWGAGAGVTTREFGASGATLYAGGGGGGPSGPGGAGGGGNGSPRNVSYAAGSGTANTGGGGGAASADHQSGAGGSGIFIIRNKR